MNRNEMEKKIDDELAERQWEEGDLEIHADDWPHVGIVLTPRNIVDLLGGLYHRKIVKMADGEVIVDLSYKVD